MISHSSIKSSISFINPPASQISQKMPYIKQLIKLGISPFLGIFNNYSNQPAGRCGGNAAENSIQAAWIALR